MIVQPTTGGHAHLMAYPALGFGPTDKQIPASTWLPDRPDQILRKIPRHTARGFDTGVRGGKGRYLTMPSGAGLRLAHRLKMFVR